MTQLRCVSCGASDVSMVGTIPSEIRFGGRILSAPLPGGDLLRCHECELAFRYPRLEKSTLDALYRQSDSEHWASSPDKRTDWRLAGDWLSRCVPRDSSILDVGCWDGAFLQSAGSNGKRYGIEINQSARERAQVAGVQIIGTDFNALAQTSALFDAVTSFDVIEHTHDPAAFLCTLAKVTRENGVVIISSGNSDAVSWKLLGARYWYCTIAEHLSFISPRWCETVAPRVGLELRQIAKFSHVQLNWRKSLGQLLGNMFYAASPGGFSWLRARGLGGSLYRSHKELLRYPPNWMSANDHFIALFVKKCT